MIPAWSHVGPAPGAARAAAPAPGLGSLGPPRGAPRLAATVPGGLTRPAAQCPGRPLQCPETNTRSDKA
eukprot:506518-Hanusia_phi.AAC.1